jgi:peptidoglycan/xylan/chitin deacetylase (PgdA/CDA1 family)
MMRVPGRKFLRRALRPIARQFFPGAVVLGYHRVAAADWDPLGLAVSPANFAAQLEVLQGLRELIGLAELAARRAAGERLERYAVLTFDDGYRDFADTVLPIAARAGVPATVFVATGFTGVGFWWEEIAALLAPRGQGGTELEVPLDGGEVLRFTGLEQAEARAAAARSLCDRLACAPREAIEAVVTTLRAWAGEGFAAAPAGRPMSAAELAGLAGEAHAEIGAHTVSHGCLARLSPDAQRQEIARSKAAIEAACGRPVKVFSYPNGSLSADTPRLVAELGFDCACTSRDGSFSGRGDPFRIPRLWAPDADGAAFRRWLGEWVAEAR